MWYAQHRHPQHNRIYTLLRTDGKDGLLARALRAAVELQRVRCRRRRVWRILAVKYVVCGRSEETPPTQRHMPVEI